MGIRGEEIGEEKELALAIAPTAQRVYRDLYEVLDQQPRALTIDLLMDYPGHMASDTTHSDNGDHGLWRDPR